MPRPISCNLSEWTELTSLDDNFKARIKLFLPHGRCIYMITHENNDTSKVWIVKTPRGSTVNLGRMPAERLLEELSSKNVCWIAGGANHMAAIHATGGVTTWGGNQFGQLGNGRRVDSDGFESAQFSPSVEVIDIVCGEQHTLALTGEGDVYVWGKCLDGCGRYKAQSTPAKLEELGDIVSIAADGDVSVALDAVGRAYAWGNNILTPTLVDVGEERVRSIAAGRVADVEASIVLVTTMQGLLFASQLLRTTANVLESDQIQAANPMAVKSLVGLKRHAKHGWVCRSLGDQLFKWNWTNYHGRLQNTELSDCRHETSALIRNSGYIYFDRMVSTERITPPEPNDSVDNIRWIIRCNLDRPDPLKGPLSIVVGAQEQAINLNLADLVQLEFSAHFKGLLNKWYSQPQLDSSSAEHLFNQLQLPEHEYAVVYNYFRYRYTGHYQLTFKQTMDLIRLAVQWEDVELIVRAEADLEQSISLATVLELSQFVESVRVNLDSLEQSVNSFLARHLPVLVKQPSFASLDKQTILRLIQNYFTLRSVG